MVELNEQDRIPYYEDDVEDETCDNIESQELKDLPSFFLNLMGKPKHPDILPFLDPRNKETTDKLMYALYHENEGSMVLDKGRGGCGYEKVKYLQERTWNDCWERNTHQFVEAKGGSGKTCCYALCTLLGLDPSAGYANEESMTQAIIYAKTFDLVDQIKRDLRVIFNGYSSFIAPVMIIGCTGGLKMIDPVPENLKPDKSNLKLNYRTEDNTPPDLEMEFQICPQTIRTQQKSHKGKKRQEGNPFSTGNYRDFIAFCNYTQKKRENNKKNPVVEDILIPEYENWLVDPPGVNNIFNGLFCNVKPSARQRGENSGELPCHWDFPEVITRGDRKYLSKPILNILVGNSTLVRSQNTKKELDFRNLRRIVVDEVDEFVINQQQEDYSDLKNLFTLDRVNWNQCRLLLYSATLMEQVEAEQRRFTDELYNAKEIRKEQIVDNMSKKIYSIRKTKSDLEKFYKNENGKEILDEDFTDKQIADENGVQPGADGYIPTYIYSYRIDYTIKGEIIEDTKLDGSPCFFVKLLMPKPPTLEDTPDEAIKLPCVCYEPRKGGGFIRCDPQNRYQHGSRLNEGDPCYIYFQTGLEEDKIRDYLFGEDKSTICKSFRVVVRREEEAGGGEKGSVEKKLMDDLFTPVPRQGEKNLPIIKKYYFHEQKYPLQIQQYYIDATGFDGAFFQGLLDNRDFMNIYCDLAQKLIKKLNQTRETQGFDIDKTMKYLIFVPRKSDAVFLNFKLYEETGAETIFFFHGNMSREDRRQILEDFRGGSSEGLIATNVLARGINIDDLDTVIMMDLPRKMNSLLPDDETYIHRVARCGRQERSGISTVVLSDQSLQVPENEYCTSIGDMINKIKSKNGDREERKGIVKYIILEDYEAKTEEQRQETDNIYLDQHLNTYFYHRERMSYWKIDYRRKIKDKSKGWRELEWDQCKSKKTMKYIHDRSCEYFVFQFKNKEQVQCLFYYNTHDDVSNEVKEREREVRTKFDEHNRETRLETDRIPLPQKIFFQRSWLEKESNRSSDDLLRCFRMIQNADLSISNCFFPLLNHTGTDREWIRSMEQKYAQSESIKYVLGQSEETNLILNAGKTQDISLESPEYPMTFPIETKNEKYGISHMQHLIKADEDKPIQWDEEQLNTCLRNYFKPIQWVKDSSKTESKKFFYFPLTIFYHGENNDNSGKIALDMIYDENTYIDSEVRWNLKRVMLRYNFNIKISFQTDRIENPFVNIFYLQYKSSSNDFSIPNLEEFFDRQFTLDEDNYYPHQPAEDALMNDLQDNIEKAEDHFMIESNLSKSWTLLRREQYSRQSVFKDLSEDGQWRIYDSHGYIFPEQGEKYLQIVEQEEGKWIEVGGFPICILLVKSHDDIQVEINVNDPKDISSYITLSHTKTI